MATITVTLADRGQGFEVAHTFDVDPSHIISTCPEGRGTVITIPGLGRGQGGSEELTLYVRESHAQLERLIRGASSSDAEIR